MTLGERELVPELGIQLAELLVRPEEEGGVLHSLPLDLEDEDVVLLRRVSLLDVVDVDGCESAVRHQPETEKRRKI